MERVEAFVRHRVPGPAGYLLLRVMALVQYVIAALFPSHTKSGEPIFPSTLIIHDLDDNSSCQPILLDAAELDTESLHTDFPFDDILNAYLNLDQSADSPTVSSLALHSTVSPVTSHSTDSPQGPKLFNCPGCSKSFPKRGYLTRHLKMHAEKKPFRCPFWSSTNRKCHTGDGQFSRRDTYKAHMKLRHFHYPKGVRVKERRFSQGCCSFCKETFDSSELWVENHIQTGRCPLIPADWSSRLLTMAKRQREERGGSQLSGDASVSSSSSPTSNRVHVQTSPLELASTSPASDHLDLWMDVPVALPLEGPLPADFDVFPPMDMSHGVVPATGFEASPWPQQWASPWPQQWAVPGFDQSYS